MIVRYISTQLEPAEYNFLDKDGDSYTSRFLFRERYIGNYLGRRLKAAKFRSDDFSSIVIEATHEGAPRAKLFREVNCLGPIIRFDQARYESLGPDEHHEFFLGMYIEGIEQAHRDFRIPYDVLMEGIEEFRRGGYKNHWQDKRKLLRPLGLHATLSCDMDTNRFQLTLKLERKGTVIFDQPVYETQPDEIMFKGNFKDIVVEDNHIVIKEEFGKTTFSLDVSTLG